MDRWATKTRSEREDEEVERLVRPAPKYKPPRHDRRREQINPDRDPDIDGDPDIAKDPDRSRNYKDVGGSASRVLLRFAQDKVPAKSRETGKVVYISPETLKEKPGEYEAVDEPADGPKKDAPKKDAPEPEGDAKYAEAGKALRQLMKGDAALESRLKSITDPQTQLGGLAKEHPGLPLAQVFKGAEFPAGMKTLGDAVKALRVAPAEKKPKAPKKDAPKKDTPAEEEPKDKPSKDEAPAPPKESTPPAAKDDAAPEETPPAKKAPEDAPPKDAPPAAADGEKPAKKKKDEQPTPQTEAQRLGLPEVARPAPTVGERKEALLLIQDTFPSDIAADLIARRLHPEDVRELVATYARAKARPVGNIEAFAEKAAKTYHTDFDTVKAPEFVKDAAGNDVPFKSLPPEQQASEYRKHQTRVLALSMAARDMLTSELTFPSLTGNPRVPVEAAQVFASFLLQRVDEKRAAEGYSRVFEAAAGDPEVKPAKLTATQAKQYLGRLPPATRKLAQAFFEGSDYRVAREKFLGEGMLKFNERDSAGRIVSGLRKATKFFQEKAEAYGTPVNAAESTFKVSVLDKLRVIDRQKYATVRAMLDQDEARAYHESLARWRKAHAQWEARRAAYDKQRDPYRSEPFEEPEPQKPAKPARYDILYAKKQAQSSADPWEEITPRGKTASNVANRFISTCSGSPAMVRDPRVAVYHGINPQENYPGAYPGWSQPHQCDLGEKDFQAILSSAKQWLTQPVLSKSVEGIEKDQQLRAALDLAIYEGPYNGQIGAVLYDQLFSRLSGGAKTAREADSRVSSCPPTQPKEDPMVAKASRTIRQFAARAASTDPSLAFDLIDFADKLASDEDEKKQSQDQAQDEKKQGQQQEQSKQASEDKFTQLRSAIIRTAAADPVAREALMPVLQSLKTLG